MSLYHCSQAVQWDTGWQEVLNPLGWLFQPTYALTIVFVSCKVEQRCPKVLKYPKCSKAWWFRYMTGKWIQMLSLKNRTGHRFLILWGNSIPEYSWVFPTVISLFEKSSLLPESRNPPPQGLQNRNCLVKTSDQLKQNWNSGNLLFGKKKKKISQLYYLPSYFIIRNVLSGDFTRGKNLIYKWAFHLRLPQISAFRTDCCNGKKAKLDFLVFNINYINTGREEFYFTQHI